MNSPSSLYSKIDDYTESISLNSPLSKNKSNLLNMSLNISSILNNDENHYKNKYNQLLFKYNYLLNQYKELKNFFMEISNIIIPSNSNKILLSLKERIKQVKKKVLEDKEFLQNNDKMNKLINIKNDKNYDKSDEQSIRVIFLSCDKKIHYSFACQVSDKFEKIENILYDKYPEYRNAENVFICNEKNIIQKDKTLKENNIRNCEVIVLYDNYNMQNITTKS